MRRCTGVQDWAWQNASTEVFLMQPKFDKKIPSFSPGIKIFRLGNETLSTT